MKHMSVWGSNLPSAYHEALYSLEKFGEISDCADWNCKQKELHMTMWVENPLEEPMISKFFPGGTHELQQYVMEMIDGILDFEVEKGKWKYTYHLRFADQIPFVVEELRRNQSSRRAVMLVRNETDMGNDDPVCLTVIQYFIRKGKLDCTVLFRSNDACKATFMNSFALIMLQKKIADELGVPVGVYIHTANSFHCYEKDFDTLKRYVKRFEECDDESEITYCYEGDWKEDMEECIPEILKMVEELKSHE